MTCLCRWIHPTENRTPLLLLQHPQESAHAKGSARLLQLSLRHCQVEAAEVFDPELLASWLGAGAVLLYPGAGPSDLPAQPQRLVVLDGTWRQTRKLLHLHPLLQQLPRIGLAAPPPSRYLIRKARHPHHRSTLEAACHALGAIESQPMHYAPLLQSFDAWVQSMTRWARPGPTPS